MTIEDYNELKLQDELMIGYEVEEDLPDEYEEDLSLIHISEPTRP